MRRGTTAALSAPERGTRLAAVACVGLVVLVGAAVTAWGTVGSDAWWPVALGDHIRAGGTVPDGIPFAAAPTQAWVNTTVVGQIMLSLVGAAGSVGLLAAQCFSVTVTLALLGWDAMRRGGSQPRTFLALLLFAIGAVPALLIARVQLLSLIPFALVLLVLRREHENPSARIWFVPLTLAVWGNLHGAVLIGVAVSGCYLAFSRLRLEPLRAVAVGIACLLATCANPGLVRAPSYYVGVFGGEATSDSSGMWGRPDLGNPFDLAMVACTLGLVLLAARRRVPLWEWVVVAGLTAGTVIASRNGVWLLAFLVGLAAAPARDEAPDRPDRERPNGRVWMALSVGVTALLATTLLFARAPALHSHDRDVALAADAAGGRVVLAPEPLSEQLAAAGARVWVSNPLDAFDGPDQSAYLAFLRGDGPAASRAFEAAGVIITAAASDDLALYREHGYTKARQVGSLLVLSR